ncbi:MAG: hypothetical protein IKV76_00855 [Clostridia bacterium]|nr:hypothetical protein [Clostridia bacterium]
MKFDEHIINQLDIYKSTNDFEMRNKTLVDDVRNSKINLLAILTEEQKSAFREFTDALCRYERSKNDEFFVDGFLMGFFSKDLHPDFEQ